MPDFNISEKFLTWQIYSREFRASLEEAHLDLSKLFSIATDGASSMLNRRLSGTYYPMASWGNFIPVLWSHCVHQENLTAKSLNMVARERS